MKFVGRKEELSKLSKIVNSEKEEFCLIYGRRRVGKSELVNKALSMANVKSIYYECKQVAHESSARGLGQIVSEIMDLPKLGYDDIETLLDYVFELAKDEKMVLVLDEYPYLRNSVKGMDSILQALVDKYRNTSKLSLIILGSYVEVMQSLLEHKNPLYGRVDLSINLKQMDYYESAMFYPNFSDEDKIRIYSVFGGIPYYNRLVDDSVSVKDNIINLIASPGARLENEVSMYLNSELSKIVNANEVFSALAQDFSKFGDILSQSHVSSGPTLVDVLDRLINMEVVVKTTPINDSTNKRKTTYSICDNLSLFYYRYVFKYASQMKIMKPSIFYRKYIEKDFEKYFVPHIFEEVCKQFLVRKNMAGEINPVLEKIGKYYYDDPISKTNGEFDIVSEDEQGYIFYEVKFRKKQISDSVIDDEIKQVNATGLDCYKYVFFSRSGFNCKKREGVSLVSIDALFD